MKRSTKILFYFNILLLSGSLNAADMALIQGGNYRPLYLKKDMPMSTVKTFKLDKTPVTNAEFAQFVRDNPQWQRGQIKPRFAEAKYLNHWVKKQNTYAPKPEDLRKPVTHVSWFAAHAYCVAQQKRLPSIDEWEYVGQASAFSKNGTNEAAYQRVILDWYANGAHQNVREVGKGQANAWGVHDMHGLIWEWTENFNSSLLLASNANESLFCGGGTANATDPSDYAAFMRYGMRTSLQAHYVLHHLGFRCAQSV